MVVTRPILELQKFLKNVKSQKNFNISLFSSFLLSVEPFLSYRQKRNTFLESWAFMGQIFPTKAKDSRKVSRFWR